MVNDGRIITCDHAWGAGTPDGCFADEAAIDFPSMADLVERARDRFLGDGRGAGTVTAELRLTRHDALSGAVVPIAVPVRRLCARCGGRGELWPDPCAACGGAGDRLQRYPVRVTVPRGVEHGARLRLRVHAPHAEPVRVEIRVAITSSAA
jgi:hypothetical protein